MFERFTDQAIKVIMIAQEEACRLGHNFVGVEFIFLGLIGEATGIASQVLRQQGITLKNARIEVEKILGRGSGMITVELPFTESAKLVLNNAVSIARQLEPESINTEHLLIGIIQEGESTARILQNLRVNPQDLTVSLSQYFQHQPSNQLPQTVYVLLYNAGTNNEGIHTITDQEKQTILMFESSADANNYARRLGEHNFPVPSVEAMKAEEILLFCNKSGYGWEFVPKGANRTPPSQPQTISQQDYLNFLIETAQKISENPNPQVIYPFWAQNLDKLDDNLLKIFDGSARSKLTKVTPEQARSIAIDIFNFSDLFRYFPFGKVAINKEIAIKGYEIVLTVFTFEAYPKEWARTQIAIGNAYLQRIRGDKSENVEKAITFYQEVRTIYNNYKDFPEDWPGIQNNLANAYFDRIKGDKAENLETAINYCQEALNVLNSKKCPQDWAMLQNILATAYCERIKGDEAENIEQAITCYKEALNVFTEEFPQEWAKTKLNLGNAYHKRIKGDKAENIEQAITDYQEALKVFTGQEFSENLAKTQLGLGNAYRDRIKGEPAENIEQAINCYQEALEAFTCQESRQEWAMTNNNLATVYLNRIREDKANNLEQAIKSCQEALTVLNSMNNPQEWARVQNTLGEAYRQRIEGVKAENLEKSIAAYRSALTSYTKDNDPRNCLLTARNLGILHYDEKQWQPATEAYNTAIEAVENARLEALNPQSRQEVLANAIDVCHRIVQAHLNLNQPEKALEYIERSKGRNLVELITQKNLHPQGVSTEIIERLNELKQRVVSEQIRLQSQSINQNLRRSDNLNPYIQDYSYLQECQQELDNFIEREIRPIDPLFSLTQKVEPIPFAEIQSLTDAETCLLQWYITGEKILAFVVSADENIKVWQSSKDDVKQLFDTFNNYLQLYYSKNGKQEWKNQLSNLLQTFADNLHINDILALIPDTCQRLIIIPHYFLHILPIHAFPINESQILQDKYDVQYAPSCQILQKISQTFHHPDFNKLLAIQNPTKDLSYTDLEVTILSSFFTNSQIIAKDNATKNTVIPHLKSSDSHCYHFSCHGRFNPDNPIDSALFLANEEPLTLGEIFELRLNKCRLVTLSACETGLIDLNSISDEYIGLPSGFLFAGSPSVVSSLWTVNDLSTSFLMIKLYEILFDENQQVSVPVALKQAQYWLQDLTIDKLDEFLQQYQPQIDKHLVQLRPGQRKIYQKSLERIRERQPYPFANPYYWAGFTATGI